MTDRSPDDLLSTGEIAKQYHIPRATVTDNAARGRLPIAKLHGTRRYFRRADVEAWVGLTEPRK